MPEEITWDELAVIYDKETGGKARIQPMERLYAWAVDSGLFIVNENGGL